MCFDDVLTQSLPNAQEFEAEREQAFRRFTLLISRAQEDGALRPDFVAEDLPMLLMANAGVVTAANDAAPETSPRLVAYMLQAFSAKATGPLPSPPTPGRMYRARRRFQRGYRPHE